MTPLNPSMKPAVLAFWAAALVVSAAPAQTPDTRINPTIQQIVDAISPERITATLRKLESFGSRNVNLPPDDPALGIGAAERWIHDELKSYNPHLEVSYHDFMVKKDARPDRLLRDVYLSNVVAVLPGVTQRDRLILVTAHYDSVNIVRKPYTGEEQMIAEMVRLGFDEAEARTYRKLVPPDVESGPPDLEATTAAAIAPGVTDDGSGTAVVMELARVMSQRQFDKTLVFIAFSAEEIGAGGSQAWAEMAKQKGMQIEAVLNNDIVGSDVSGNGRSATNVLRVFSGADESPTRELGRYVKRMGERYVPSMQLEMVFRRDRFLRGGDHTPFAERGFAAVRLTTASENTRISTQPRIRSRTLRCHTRPAWRRSTAQSRPVWPWRPRRRC